MASSKQKCRERMTQTLIHAGLGPLWCVLHEYPLLKVLDRKKFLARIHESNDGEIMDDISPEELKRCILDNAIYTLLVEQGYVAALDHDKSFNDRLHRPGKKGDKNSVRRSKNYQFLVGKNVQTDFDAAKAQAEDAIKETTKLIKAELVPALINLLSIASKLSAS